MDRPHEDGNYCSSSCAGKGTQLDPMWASLIEFERDGTRKGNYDDRRGCEGRKAEWIWPAVAAASFFGMLALGVIIWVTTDKRHIKIVIDDHKAVVKVDGNSVRIEGLGEPISLREGQHAVEVMWGDGKFTTKRFEVRRGDKNEALVVEYKPTRERSGNEITNPSLSSGSASTKARKL